MAQNLPLAWKQLSFEPIKLLTATAGVMVAVMLMWIQMGILASVYDSATTVHKQIQADLVVLHPLSENLGKMKPLSTRTLYRVRGHADVAAIGEFLCAPVDWRNPENGEIRQIMVFGFDPEDNWLDLPGIQDHASDLLAKDTFLFGRNSKNVFGPVIPWLEAGKPFEVELGGRVARPVGLTNLAASFGQEGAIITNRANFLRFHPKFPPEEVHLGLIRLHPESDAAGIKEAFQKELAPEALVMTPEEFRLFELRYWQTNAPVGFIFTMGTAIGFFIGFIVVYQILHTDVSNHLPQFATMKAMGFTDTFLLWIVMRQGLLLSILGYIPGSLLAIGFYALIKMGTSIPISANWERAAFLLSLTVVMCLLSGAMATTRLRAADPADVF